MCAEWWSCCGALASLPEPSHCGEAARSLPGPSAADREEGWNHGTLLHLSTRQPITKRAGFASALATPRFLGDGNNWAYPKRGRLISPPDRLYRHFCGRDFCDAAKQKFEFHKKMNKHDNVIMLLRHVLLFSSHFRALFSSPDKKLNSIDYNLNNVE